MSKSVVAMVLLFTCAASAARAAHPAQVPDVINASALDWARAARTGRADILVLGDSLVGSFFPGIELAAQKQFGLAGTGLGAIGPAYNGHAIFAPYPTGDSGWEYDPANAPVDRRGYVWNGSGVANAHAQPATNYSFILSPGGVLDPQAPYKWQVFTAAQPGGGSLAARRLLAEPPYTLQYVLPAQPTTAPPAAGLRKVTFDLPAVSAFDGKASGGNLIDATNTSVFYSRLLKPGAATGATVTYWNEGGKSSLEFLREKYLQGPTSPEGRGQLYSAITDEGSGKLLVVLLFGINDRGRDSVPSAHGLTPGNSPAAFVDNMTTLIDQVRADWAVAGKNPDDLAFLVNGLYADGYDAGSTVAGRTREYAGALHDLAVARPDVSFFDIYPLAPDYDRAVSLGYMADAVHPTLLGASVYSDAMIAALVPEPAGAGVVVAAAVACVAAPGRRLRRNPRAPAAGARP